VAHTVQQYLTALCRRSEVVKRLAHTDPADLASLRTELYDLRKEILHYEKEHIRVFWRDEDDGFIAVCDAYQYISGYGETRQWALVELRNALRLALQEEREQENDCSNPAD
jgi:hypothetical protein